jgi:Enoyl-(Acyl carrier protein) reductase
MACKHVLPIMRRQRAGTIVNISSVAAYENTYPLVAYKATKAMIAFTEQLALHNAPHGIRSNCILPGLMDTPMAVDTRARVSNRSRAEVAAERDARVPLRGKMGTGWGVANAALFLASDEANFHHWRGPAGRWRRAGQGRRSRRSRRSSDAPGGLIFLRPPRRPIITSSISTATIKISLAPRLRSARIKQSGCLGRSIMATMSCACTWRSRKSLNPGAPFRTRAGARTRAERHPRARNP